MLKILLLFSALLAAYCLAGQPPQLLKDINPGTPGSLPYHLTFSDDYLLFQAYDDVHGRQPWVSDGTPGGTMILKEVISPQFPPGVLSAFFTGNGRTWFWSRDGVLTQLWVTDGTTAGTGEIFGTTENAYDFFTKSWVIGNHLLALRKDPFSGMLTTFLSDGTSGGSGLTGWQIDNALSSSEVVLDSLYFVGYTGDPGQYQYHIYRSDGTQAGTEIAEQDAGFQNTSEYRLLSPLKNLSGHLGYVVFSDSFPFDGENQLLRIRGFPDVHLKPGQKFGYDFAVVGNYLFFEAPTHPDSVFLPKGLYVFDGITTSLLLEYQGQFPFGNQLDFVVNTDYWAIFRENRVTGSRLWFTDGTVAGTKVIFDPLSLGLPDSTSIGAARYIPDNNTVLFTTSHNLEFRFWKYAFDGETVNSLFQFTSTSPYGTDLREWVYFKGSIYFTADDGQSGSEVWTFPYPVVGVDEPAQTAAGRLDIWPNPCSDRVVLRPVQTLESAGEWTLFDTRGCKVASYRVWADGREISLAGLPAGLYVYTFVPEGGNAILYGKLVKQ